MRRVVITTLVVAVPQSALAAGSGGFDFVTSLAQMLGALAVVLGLIYLLSYVSRRWFKGGIGRTRRQSYIRVVETHHLAPKKSLMLVEVGGEYLLLSNGADGTHLIKQIDMLEEIEVVEVINNDRQLPKPRFQESLDSFMNRMQVPQQLSTGTRGNL